MLYLTIFCAKKTALKRHLAAQKNRAYCSAKGMARNAKACPRHNDGWRGKLEVVEAGYAQTQKLVILGARINKTAPRSRETAGAKGVRGWFGIIIIPTDTSICQAYAYIDLVC